MPWPVRHLTDVDKERIREILAHHEQWLKSEIDGWPANGCADTCSTIIDDLRDELGTHGLRWKLVSGSFYDEDQDESSGHVWIEIADGTIIDPTAGQFIGGPALHILPEGDARYVRKR